MSPRCSVQVDFCQLAAFGYLRLCDFVSAIVLHALYFLYSRAVFGGMWCAHRLRLLGQFVSRFAEPRRMLWLLLLVTLLKGWLWSVVIPIWQANDEDQHFGYAQEIARQGTWQISPPEQVPQERVLLWNLVSPLRLSVQREPLDLSPEALSQIDQLKQQLYLPSSHTTLVPPIWFPTFIRQHPPLYYALEAGIHQLGSGNNILVRMAWMRLLSVLLGVGTVACAYGAARVLWKEQKWFPLIIATFVSFHPLFTFFTSVVNNAALEILCWSALVWLMAVIVWRGMDWRRSLALAGVISAGLLTRSSFVAVIPLIGALLAYDIWRQRGKIHWEGLGVIIGLPLLVAGWWYRDFLFTGGGAFVQVYIGSLPPERAVSLLDRVGTPVWFARYYAFLNEWWGVFGWRDTWFPAWVYNIFDYLTLFAFLGLIWLGVHALWLRIRRGQKMTISFADRFAMLVGLGSTFALIAFYTVLDYRMAIFGARFRMQGRYLLAAVVPQMMLLGIGWAQFSRRWVLPALLVGMIGLNIYALVGVLVPRYYGEQIVANFPPGDAGESLGAGVVARRTLSMDPALSRVDVWLSRSDDKRTSDTMFMLRGDAVVVNRSIEPGQMTFPYPTVLRFDNLPARKQWDIAVAGEGGEVILSADGQIALKAYRYVPIWDILNRIAVVQPSFYNTVSILALTGANLLCLAFFIAVCVFVMVRRH